jgi:pyrroline-5-carboxylate reductase
MRLGMIGAGNMATALARGLDERVLVSDVDAERARRLADAVGGVALNSNDEVVEQADVVVLCHKPAQLGEVAGALRVKPRALVSILAATRTGEVEAAYPDTPVYRFIPNIPVEVGRGVLCYAAGSRASEGPEQEILELFSRAGIVLSLDEGLIEPAMALMSCGPAFLAAVVEALVEAGTAHGLERTQASRMTVETMAGTAAYLEAHELDAEGLRRMVATPGGVTERGLAVLEEKGMGDAFKSAVDTVVEATAR